MNVTTYLILAIGVTLPISTGCKQDSSHHDKGVGASQIEATLSKPSSRRFMFSYDVTIRPIPVNTGPIDVFIPLAKDGPNQTVLHQQLSSSIPGKERTEPKYGNTYWHGHVDRSDGKPITVSIKYQVSRRRQYVNTNTSGIEYSPERRTELHKYLSANARVPIDGELIDTIRKRLSRTDPTPMGRARAIYDYVLTNMQYKKVGTGWGNGDTYWACDKGYGNCTDFHALFTSLARAEGIASRFEIGFPIPDNGKNGTIAGYHCWLQFYIGGVGWVPVDASEAWKHPKKRQLLFGTQPTDRIRFTVGRDLKLGEGHNSGPLNYFVYPHVEINGKRSTNYTTEFHFADID